jgi:hypothetical protein
LTINNTGAITTDRWRIFMPSKSFRAAALRSKSLYVHRNWDEQIDAQLFLGPHMICDVTAEILREGAFT